MNFSLLGGMWNDRLSDLQSMNEDYYISSTFYNSMKLGDEFINSVGSSDAVLVKVDSVSHEILVFFPLILSGSGCDQICLPHFRRIYLAGWFDGGR